MDLQIIRGNAIKKGCVDQLKVEMMTRVAVNVIKIFACVPKKKNIGEEPTRYKQALDMIINYITCVTCIPCSRIPILQRVGGRVRWAPSTAVVKISG